jgi:hypothetical protein
MQVLTGEFKKVHINYCGGEEELIQPYWFSVTQLTSGKNPYLLSDLRETLGIAGEFGKIFRPSYLFEEFNSEEHGRNAGIDIKPKPKQAKLLLNQIVVSKGTKIEDLQGEKQALGAYVIDFEGVTGKDEFVSDGNYAQKNLLLNIASISEDSGRLIVRPKTVYPLAFNLENSKFRPEDLDPETGFIKNIRPKTEKEGHGVFFNKDIRIGTVFIWEGGTCCTGSLRGNENKWGARLVSDSDPAEALKELKKIDSLYIVEV